jgi:hypothetical protein
MKSEEQEPRNTRNTPKKKSDRKREKKAGERDESNRQDSQE